MAIIGIIGDRDCDIETSNLSEVHYVLRPGCTYVTAEFALTPKETISELILCIHGSIETTEDRVKKLESSRSYKKLFQLSDCKLTASNGVYDFRHTWGLEAITNQCYEGPAPFNAVVVHITGSQISYYGCRAQIPEIQYEVETLDGCTLVTMSRKDGIDFSADQLCAFRLGFFLLWPKGLLKTGFWQSLTQFFTGGKFINYPVHTFSCPPEAELTFRSRTDIKSRLDRNYLCIDLSTFTQRYTEENADDPLIGTIEEWSPDATSDLWIVIPENDVLDVASEMLEGASELAPSPVRYGLYTHRTMGFPLPYKEFHIKYKKNMRPLMGSNRMKPTQPMALQLAQLWQIRMQHFDIRSWAKRAIRGSGVLAVLLAINSAFAWNHDYLLWNFLAFPLAYMAIILVIGLRDNLK